jgi:hypothetical protein
LFVLRPRASILLRTLVLDWVPVAICSKAVEAARFLSHTLGEEESADFLLTAISDPLLQQASLDDLHADVDLASVPAQSEKTSARGRRSSKAKVRRNILRELTSFSRETLHK